MKIAGVLLRNYKVYKNVNFIPFFKQQYENLKIFIGQNGCGKSSILEALDSFFYNTSWTAHLDAIKEDVYVAPLFLISKDELNSRFPETSELIQKISDFLWNVQVEDNNSKYPHAHEYFTFRNSIKEKYSSSHSLLLLGYRMGIGSASFVIFDEAIKKIIGFHNDKRKIQNKIDKIFKEIENNITYLYIPTDTNIPEFLRLESKDMQELMDKNIVDNIDKILSEEYENPNGEKEKNIIDSINNKLQPYVAEVENTIQKIYSGYKFQTDFQSSSKLTSRDLSRQIIKSFYAKRRLKKDGKDIRDLSSGEKKSALIDIAYSFLSREDSQDKEIILAIDEPESSLDISIRYDQFERITNLANKFNRQILITTHWYGALPIIQKGVIHHLKCVEEQAPSIVRFDACNYFEERKKHPDDIYFKSFFDLASSIVSSMRNKEINWLIVEGQEDKNYLEYYLNKEKEICKILSVGGCGPVKILYQYLYLPMKSSDAEEIKGKIFCLIDTDIDSIKLDFPSQIKNVPLLIRRLQYFNNEVKLFKIEDQRKSPIEIEHVLIPSQFFQALSNVIQKEGDDSIKEVLKKYEFDETMDLSLIKNYDSLIYQKTDEGESPKDNLKLVTEFIEEHKYQISIEYCKLESTAVPIWINKIKNFFAGNSKPQIKNTLTHEERTVAQVKNVLKESEDIDSTVPAVFEAQTISEPSLEIAEPNIEAVPIELPNQDLKSAEGEVSPS